jgi:hypothetical protein
MIQTHILTLNPDRLQTDIHICKESCKPTLSAIQDDCGKDREFVAADSCLNLQDDALRKEFINSAYIAAEGEGFEPPVGCPTTVFKTVALDRSAIPPDQKILPYHPEDRWFSPQGFISLCSRKGLASINCAIHRKIK